VILQPRFSLAQLPTPLESLPRLTAALGGPRLWIKRDDQTGLALGGNKTRKLEFLIADALAKKADVILTAGAAQSNHCRQTAAAAAKAGLRCVLILGGNEPEVPNGNLLLDRLLGAEVHWTTRERRLERMAEIAEQMRKDGHVPYVIPYGGSNGVGAQGYFVAMKELMGQLHERKEAVEYMIVASSSGGTQAGLVLGAKVLGFAGRIIGISIDKGERDPDRFEDEMAAIANATAAVMGVSERVSAADFEVDYGYLGGGYGVVGELEREAISLMATREGIILDPVYAGRAFGAMLDMIRRGFFGEPDREKNKQGAGAIGGREAGGKQSAVLFWHTGGAPACFAYGEELGVGSRVVSKKKKKVASRASRSGKSGSRKTKAKK
jgi:D-cysteine desulfhydrase family pyridoxal phosphate-dependent enzyme